MRSFHSSGSSTRPPSMSKITVFSRGESAYLLGAAAPAAGAAAVAPAAGAAVAAAAGAAVAAGAAGAAVGCSTAGPPPQAASSDTPASVAARLRNRRRLSFCFSSMRAVLSLHCVVCFARQTEMASVSRKPESKGWVCIDPNSRDDEQAPAPAGVAILSGRQHHLLSLV